MILTHEIVFWFFIGMAFWAAHDSFVYVKWIRQLQTVALVLFAIAIAVAFHGLIML